MSKTKNSKAAATLGSIKSEAKAEAARQNGRKGGRPPALTGGRAGFARAIDEAFRSQAVNPVIRYSHDGGFRAESGIHPRQEDDLWQRSIFRCAQSGIRSVNAYDYSAVREEILEEENGRKEDA